MLREVLSNLFKKPATVVALHGVPVPPGFRGAPYLERPAECVGCALCSKDCPAGCIEMTEFDGRKLPVFLLDRCAFCAQCADSCPRKVIKMAPDWEEAVFQRKDLRREPGSKHVA
jgi:formate hydrogenlyase subunit 6/NADH:ubiquinone oxidoreductase subunit I